MLNNKFILINILVLFVAAGLLGFWYLGAFSTSAEDLLNVDAAAAPLSRVKARVGDTVIDTELAVTPAQLSRGLSYRDSLDEDSGMLFLFKNRALQNFWMQGMRFPLDFVWIDGDKVVDITEDVQAPKGLSEHLRIYSPRVEVNKVLEVNSGFVAKNGIKVGDRLTFDKN